jgi:Phospholipase_D-nuclease N-terminal
MLIATSTFLQVTFALLVTVPVIILWIAAVVDVIRHGHSGLKIAAVLVLVLIVPIVGPLLYFIFRKPEAHSAEDIAMAQADLRREAARRPVGGTGMYG